MGWLGFIEAAVFIAILLAGLFYLVRIGALNWTPVRSRRETAGKSHVRLTSGKHPQQ